MKIKRFTTLLIVALAGMAMMFAVDGAGQSTTNGGGTGSTVSTQLSLEVVANDLQTYHFGFTTSASAADLEAVNKAPAGTVTLTATEAKGFKASNLENPVYVYYNVRTNQDFKLSIATPKHLTGRGKAIPFCLKFASGTNTTVNSSNDGNDGTPWELSVSNPNGAADATVKMDVETIDAIPLDQAADTYTTDVTLTITIG